MAQLGTCKKSVAGHGTSPDFPVPMLAIEQWDDFCNSLPHGAVSFHCQVKKK